MSDFWYYAQGDDTRGPVTFYELIKILSSTPNAKRTMVWREGFSDWKTADSIREIVEQLFRPPPLRPNRSTMAGFEAPVPPPLPLPDVSVQLTDIAAREQQRSDLFEAPPPVVPDRRGRAAFLIVLVMVIALGAYLANQLYGNSLNGVAYLFGELIGPWIILSAITWKWRRLTYTAAVVLAFAALSVVSANFNKLQRSSELQETKIALQKIASPADIADAVKRYPSNTFLQMMAVANDAATETNAAVEKLSDEIEPPTLSKDVELITANKKELEALRGDLKIAVSNTAAFMSRYGSLLKTEREKVENFAKSRNVERELIASFLGGIDKRHATSKEFISKLTLARYEFYSAYENYVAILLEDYGSYSAVDGKFTFKLQRTADRFNAAASAMNAAAKRMNELEAERKKLAQSQQAKWEEFVNRK